MLALKGDSSEFLMLKPTSLIRNKPVDHNLILKVNYLCCVGLREQFFSGYFSFCRDILLKPVSGICD